MDFSQLSKTFSTRHLLKDDTLFREGDEHGDGYIIKEGSIILTRKLGVAIMRAAIIEKEEVLGVWKVLFNTKKRFFTAQALVTTSVLVIPEQNLKSIINNADPFLIYCFKQWLNVTRGFMHDYK